MANLKGGSKTQNITFFLMFAIWYRIPRGEETTLAIRILVVLRVRIGWGKSPGDTLECSREASEGASVLLLSRTVWNEDVMLRVL